MSITFTISKHHLQCFYCSMIVLWIIFLFSNHQHYNFCNGEMVISSTIVSDEQDMNDHDNNNKQKQQQQRLLSWSIETYPNPNEQAMVCRTRTSSRLCDPDSIIVSEKDLQSIEHILVKNRVLSSDCTKKNNNDNTIQQQQSIEVQFGVALLKKMNLESTTSVNNVPKEVFARSIHDQWGVGLNSVCGGTGVLLVLSELDRFVFISRGSALDNILTDYRLDKIIDEMKPYLREQLYSDAIILTLKELDKLLQAGEPQFWEHVQLILNDYAGAFMFGGLFGLIVWLNKINERHRKEYAKVASHLSEIDEARAKALQGKFQMKSCPICLESFIPCTTDNTTRTDQKDGTLPISPSTVSGVINVNTVDDNKYDDNLLSNGRKQIQKMAFDSHQKQMQGSQQKQLMGSDGLPLKLLRCGHVFDVTCWKEWVNSGHGNIDRCPICQQDVGPTSSLGSRKIPNRLTTMRRRSNVSNNHIQNIDLSDSYGNTGEISNGCQSTEVLDDSRSRTDLDSVNTELQPLVQQRETLHNTELDRQSILINQFTNERNFRLNRLAALHPTFIQRQHIDRWTQANYDGSLAQDPTFISNNPVQANVNGNYNTTNGTSFSSGFGGGCSSGGRGGSW